jgi:hypothetical protein
MLMLEIYGKVEDGKVIEYPVYKEHIINRSHPFEWYSKVIYADQPELAVDEYAKEILTVGVGIINCSYTIEKLSLQALLVKAGRSSDGLTKVLAKDLDPILLAKVIEYVLQYSSNRLELFVKSKGYDSVLSAISYKDSLVDKYKSEANQVIIMRDNLWNTLLTYVDSVKSGSVDFPVSTVDIDKVIGSFSFTELTTSV